MDEGTLYQIKTALGYTLPGSSSALSSSTVTMNTKTTLSLSKEQQRPSAAVVASRTTLVDDEESDGSNDTDTVTTNTTDEDRPPLLHSFQSQSSLAQSFSSNDTKSRRGLHPQVPPPPSPPQVLTQAGSSSSAKLVITSQNSNSAEAAASTTASSANLVAAPAAVVNKEPTPMSRYRSSLNTFEEARHSIAAYCNFTDLNHLIRANAHVNAKANPNSPQSQSAENNNFKNTLPYTGITNSRTGIDVNKPHPLSPPPPTQSPTSFLRGASFLQLQLERLIIEDDEDAAELTIEFFFEMHLGDAEHSRALAEFIEAKGCEYLVQCMKVHADCFDIQWKLVKLMIPMTFQNENFIVSMLQAGAAKAILRTMKKFSQREKVQRYGCSVLQNLASPVHPPQTIVVSADGVHVLLNAMKTFRRCSSIQMACCNCLALLSFHCESNKRVILQEGGGSALADTQRLFANSEKEDEEGVEEAALVALKSLYSTL